MDAQVTYTVGEVAKLARVSVRTLHHYDEVGLVRPPARSAAGYRLYSAGDLALLQQVLFYKELGFALDEIRALVASPGFDRREALLGQRELIARRIRQYEAMIGLIDKTLASIEGLVTMSKEEMFEVFGDFDPNEHREEVEERWGETDAYRESARRTKGYTKEDWKRFKEESEEITGAVVSLMEEGVAPGDPRAMDAVDRARLQIDRWFYPCSREMHANLGRMYIADPRFTATYEKIRPGLAQYMCDAILANEARGE